jgi:hypothetical protein
MFSRLAFSGAQNKGFPDEFYSQRPVTGPTES